MDSVDPTMSSRFRSLFPDDPSKRVHEIISNGIPGQIGYGFLMGYSSGFCLKKVSKLVAFSVGGLFIIIQTLSFNGYMQVNYEKVEKAAEKVLDVNHDGKVDAKDAEAAYDKLSEVLGYHMPTYVLLAFSPSLLLYLSLSHKHTGPAPSSPTPSPQQRNRICFWINYGTSVVKCRRPQSTRPTHNQVFYKTCKIY